ncbi:EAL domain-containing protein [Trinickia violacea]|uniref:cyclic-guanylate-specific phosphodiesterase n=1 Tax=Trinickia violacea TaxID=2571746 RepID=A0A4P8J1L1_9BURK|nr:EAL domain-containing protein [Trinickia violacea]QCP54706.1 EAL domain-containing protein [Trinickia violacea]
MRRLSLISVSVAVVACAATLAPVLTSLYVANRDAAHREQSDLQEYAEKAVLRSELVTRQAFTAIADIAAVSQQECSPAFLQQLARISFTYRYVQDSGAYGGGEYRCSPLLGDVRYQHFKLPPPDWQSEDGYQVWFHQKSPLDVAREDLMIGRNGDYVSIDPQSYVDVIDEDRRPIAAVNVETNTIFALSPGANSAEMLAAWKQQGKVTSRDWLYAVARSPTRPWGVVVKSPRVGLLTGWTNLLAAWLSVGVLAGALVGWMAFRLLSRQLSFPALLERAIKRGDFDVYYQPIVKLADRECVGAEALVRWLVDGRYLSPEIFVPVAEERDLIQPLTDLVLQKMLAELTPLLRSRPAFYVSINVGVADLQSDRFLRVLTSSLKDTGIRPDQVRIEATERSFLDADATRKTIEAFRSAGHPVYIDDFGTGYSSLAYLQNFKVDVLKIDKAFIDTIAQEAATSIVAPHIISMAHALGLAIVAEGVEHTSQADYLAQHDVQYGQGWLFGAPMPAGALIEYLQARSVSSAFAAERSVDLFHQQ